MPLLGDISDKFREELVEGSEACHVNLQLANVADAKVLENGATGFLVVVDADCRVQGYPIDAPYEATVDLDDAET